MVAGLSYAAESALSVVTGFKGLSPVVPALGTAAAIVATGFADVPGIWQAQANLEAMAARLDEGNKGAIAQLAALPSSAGWIADDASAFTVHFANNLRMESGALFSYFERFASHLNEIGDLFFAYYIDVAAFALPTLGLVSGCLAMLATPAAPEAWAMLERIGMFAVRMAEILVSKVAQILGTFGVVMGILGNSLLQLYHIFPNGEAAIDFSRAKVSTAPPSVYLAPKKESPSMQGEQDPKGIVPGGAVVMGSAPGTNTLSDIAKKAYGDPDLWPRIWRANRDKIGDNPDEIPSGVRLNIPPAARHAL